MSSHYEAPIRKPLVIGDKSYHDITEDIARPIEESNKREIKRTQKVKTIDKIKKIRNNKTMEKKKKKS
jgi:hypothetical protein